jgi:type IV pilus assembly protein PilW
VSALPSTLLCAVSVGRRGAAGFTLVELMVTVAIALFLLGGLLTVVQNVRQAYGNQQALAQLQDRQRFAMTVLTDVIQAGGYFPDPKTYTANDALPSATNYVAGQAFWGLHSNTAPGDSIAVRYMTKQNDQVILCDGSTNTNNPFHTYTNGFSVVAGGAAVQGGQLQCQLDTKAPVALVNGVQSMSIFYGVKRTVTNDYNVDVYLTADQMQPADWPNISSVRVRLVFTNPLAGQPGQLGTIPFERVVAVMARAGVHL